MFINEGNWNWKPYCSSSGFIFDKRLAQFANHVYLPKPILQIDELKIHVQLSTNFGSRQPSPKQTLWPGTIANRS